MKAGKHDVLLLSHRLANFLFTYRSTPHATTQQPSCSLFLGRTIRTRLDLLRPSLQDQVMAKQASQKDQHDQHAHSRSLEAGQPVMVKNMRPGDNWIPGVIMKQLGPVSFLADVGEGRAWKRHLDHLKIQDLPEPLQEVSPEEVPAEVVEAVPTLMEPSTAVPVTVTPSRTEVPDHAAPISIPVNQRSPMATSPSVTPSTTQSSPTQTRPVPVPRRSTRLRNKPDSLSF